MRHLISGIDCAIAGAATATAAPATPKPVTLIKSRRFIELSPWVFLRFDAAFLLRPDQSMEHPGRDFHPELPAATQKARPSCEDRAFRMLLKA
jgi:hypothetical protein